VEEQVLRATTIHALVMTLFMLYGALEIVGAVTINNRLDLGLMRIYAKDHTLCINELNRYEHIASNGPEQSSSIFERILSKIIMEFFLSLADALTLRVRSSQRYDFPSL